MSLNVFVYEDVTVILRRPEVLLLFDETGGVCFCHSEGIGDVCCCYFEETGDACRCHSEETGGRRKNLNN